MSLPDIKALDAAIIDLDGTLVDTLADFEIALNRMLLEMALPLVTRGFVERSVGKGSEYLLQRTLAQVGAGNTLLERAMALYQQHYAQVNGRRSEVFAGVVPGLQRLQALGLKLACLTNKPGAFARPLLQAKGLDGFFGPIFGGDSFERKKPHPLPLLKTCEALGSLPGRTLMVGDSINDVRAARAAGCPVVLVSYGYNHGQPAASAGPDLVVDRLDELFPEARNP